TAGMPIGLMTARGPAMVVGIWGILKAGGAYVPVDPSYPASRRNYLICDSGMQVLLSDQVFDGEAGISVVSVYDERIEDFPCTAPAVVNDASGLAYILYTSGTTGRPKGVRISHGNVLNLTQWLSQLIYADHPEGLT